jgi:hypothetical protein
VAVAWVKTRLPVRSAIYKQDTGGLVVRWVTTSESSLLYVLPFFSREIEPWEEEEEREPVLVTMKEISFWRSGHVVMSKGY